MSQIVSVGHGLGQVLVEVQRPRDGAGNLGHFHRVGQSGYVVVAGWGNKHLGFVFQSSECFGVNNPVPVPLVLGAQGTGGLLSGPASRAF